MSVPPPKKPSFKKSGFSVPKFKPEVKSGGDCDIHKKVLKEHNNTVDKTPEKTEKEVTEAGDNPDASPDKKENNDPVKEKKVKPKSKKSLFQAPVPIDPQKSEDSVADEPGPSKKQKKKMFQVNADAESSTDVKKPKKKKITDENKSESSESKKPKKKKKSDENENENMSSKKASSDGPDVSHEKVTDCAVTAEKEESCEKDEGDIASAMKQQEMVENLDANDDKEAKQPKEKNGESDTCSNSLPCKKDDEQSVKEETELISKEKADLREDTVCKNPPRSLTEEEYADIFQAVIDRCNSTTLDEMYKSLNKPAKLKAEPVEASGLTKEKKSKPVKVPKVRKQKDTKKTKENQDEHIAAKNEIDQAGPSNIKQNVEESEKEEDKVDLDNEDDNEVKNMEEEQNTEEFDESEEEDEMEEEVQAISNMIPDEVVPNLPGVSDLVAPDYQEVNENTPEGSEVDYQVPIQKTPPPKKTKKVENNSSNKKHKLAPKQLIFPKGIVDNCYGKSKLSENEKKSSKKQLHMGEKNVTKTKDTVKHKKDKNISKLKTDHPIKDSSNVVKEKSRQKELKERLASMEKLDSSCIVKEKSRRKELQERLANREKLGTWVQCSNKSCSKWRFLSDCEDPSALPDVWTCDLNSDEKYNSCNKAEQNYDEAEHIFTDFAEGSVVWAKMAGFPWWPAMVEIDPDTECYFLLMTEYSMYPSHYHVVFFDDKVSRAWVNSSSIKKFTGNNDDDKLIPKPTKGGKGYASFAKDLSLAKTNALLAFDMTVQDRLKNFSFAKRYRGTYGKPYSDSPDVTPKSKKQKSSRKRKISTMESEMIESAIEEENNEDDVLKGFEEVLDAMDEEMDDVDEETESVAGMEADEDSEMSEDIDVKEDSKGKKPRRTSKTNKKANRSGDKGKSKKIRKPTMFIINENDESDDEMVVPFTPVKSDFDDIPSTSTPVKDCDMMVPVNISKPLNLDSDIFTMDLDHSITEASEDCCKQNKKSEQSSNDCGSSRITEKSPCVQKHENLDNSCSDDLEKCCGKEDSVEMSKCIKAEKVKNPNEKQESDLSQCLTADNECGNIKKSMQHSDSSPGDSCQNDSDFDNKRSEGQNRSDKIAALEQDEQMVPDEDDASPAEEMFDFEMSHPVEIKPTNQLVNHVVAPAVVELAYDSDPFDMEE